MGVHKVRKGLDLPVQGQPAQEIDQTSVPGHVALLADDYIGMKPTMLVAVGDAVRRGQALFEDKKTPGVRYTAPAGGTITQINRGARRALQSVVVRLDATELAGGDDCVAFESFTSRHPSELSAAQARALLVESGLWTALRARPYGRVPAIGAKPHSLFVTAADTNPLAPSADVVMRGNEEHFARGVAALSKAADGVRVYVCTTRGSAVAAPTGPNVRLEEFEGPHPSGTPGLHIHVLDPVDRDKQVWHVDYQDAIAIGKLFGSGKLHVDRVISLAGPAVRRPRLLRTRLGGSTEALTARELNEGATRTVSGSVLSGRRAEGAVFGYLGRYHSQISALREDGRRRLLGWLAPGANTFSVLRVFLGKWLPARKYSFTTTTNGSVRAMVPVGVYERVMPMDILPAPLLRCLLVANPERAEELGALELIEEDLALCSFVSPEKAEYGALLRTVLTTLEKEG
jgi:Na+-transporting NADH:ubiquinone oxidoreductase subunit A